MKVLKLIGLALVATMICAGFNSCSGDDEPATNPNVTNALIGTWNVLQTEVQTLANGKVVGREVYINGEARDNYKRIFKDDYTWESWIESNDGHWTLEETGKWSQQSGKLYISHASDNKTETIIIQSLSNTELVIQFPEKWVRNYHDGATWVEEKSVEIETLTKE